MGEDHGGAHFDDGGPFEGGHVDDGQGGWPCDGEDELVVGQLVDGGEVDAYDGAEVGGENDADLAGEGFEEALESFELFLGDPFGAAEVVDGELDFLFGLFFGLADIAFGYSAQKQIDFILAENVGHANPSSKWQFRDAEI